MRNTIIKDPVLEPFHLSKDQYCYTVVETITPDEKNIENLKKRIMEIKEKIMKSNWGITQIWREH